MAITKVWIEEGCIVYTEGDPNILIVPKQEDSKNESNSDCDCS